MSAELNSAARQLTDWFVSVLRTTDRIFSGVGGQGAHRDAVLLDALRRHSRTLLQSNLDDTGNLYSPLCYFLSAACQKLGFSLSGAHWLAALENVIALRQQIEAARAESAVGMDLGSAAALFKLEFDEAVNQTGLVAGASYLDKQDRHVALGLAVNWGMRFLLAYAAESSPLITRSGERDLAWIAGVVKPLLDDLQCVGDGP